MKLYEFLMLDEAEQYQAVWDKGTHIETLAQEDKICQLYAINNFYVEIHYDPLSNSIIGKNQFKQGEHLDKYLKGFGLSE